MNTVVGLLLARPLSRDAYPIARLKRTSRLPSPNTTRKWSSEGFVFWVLRRVTELPEAFRGDQTSENTPSTPSGE